MSGESRAIVAVFGGNDVGQEVRDLARQLGRVIARRDQILLTGGGGPGVRKVKELAIAGAEDGRWVGVPQSDGKPGQARTTDTFVIVSGLHDERNWLEAHLCDAAVALHGEEGTFSEIVFSLALGKPVALAATKWQKTFLDPPDPRPMFAPWARDAIAKAGSRARDRQFVPDLETVVAGLTANFRDRAMGAASATPEGILGLVLDRLAGSRPGGFPISEGYEGIRTEYTAWARSARSDPRPAAASKAPHP